MNKNTGIDYFNRGHWLTRIQERVSLKARRKMFELAREKLAFKKNDSVLDVGTTPDQERADSNCIIPWFLSEGMKVTLSSPENIDDLRIIFPGVEVIRALPQTQVFDVIASSAVLEHVGSHSQQVKFLSDCAAAGKSIFVTTPNRWHWLEFHTKIPLIHWLPKPLHRKLLKLLGKDFWSLEKNLNLVSRQELLSMARSSFDRSRDFNVQTIWTLGMPSNLILISRQREVE